VTTRTLRTSVVAALALTLTATAGSAAAGPAASGPTASGPDRAAAGTGPARGLDLDAATIPDLQQQMDDGSLTAVRLTGAYLNRIRTVDRDVNAVLEVNPHAMRDAAASDVRRRAGEQRGPLDGIPVLLKDNIDTAAQGATAGSRALLGSRPDDAHLVQRLRDAGAVVIGKANLSQWANFRGFAIPSGWSSVGGQTNNPYVLDRNPCGSSSGSAAGVAASLAQVAIGTETNGSIVCPAGATGVVGLKPSLGLVSRDGVVPISLEQDTAGPISRHVVDSAITLSVLQGADPADDVTAGIPPGQTTDYAAALDADALDGARLGLWTLETGSPETDAVTARTVQALRDAGAEVVEVELPYQDVVDGDAFPALQSEFRRDLNSYLEATPGRFPQDLAALIEFNERDRQERVHAQEIFELSQQAPGTDDPEYLALRAGATDAARRSIDETLARHDLDAIVAPTNSPAWTTDPADDDDFLFGTSAPAAVAGYPNVTVPAGYSPDGLPVGLSVFASQWQDAQVLSLAYAFERATGVRVPPRYRPTLD